MTNPAPTPYQFPERALHDRSDTLVSVSVADLQTLRDSLAAQVDHAHAPQWIDKTTCKTTGQRVLNRIDGLLAEAGFPENGFRSGRYNTEAKHRGMKRDWSLKWRGELK